MKNCFGSPREYPHRYLGTLFQLRAYSTSLLPFRNSYLPLQQRFPEFRICATHMGSGFSPDFLSAERSHDRTNRITIHPLEEDRVSASSRPYSRRILGRGGFGARSLVLLFWFSLFGVALGVLVLGIFGEFGVRAQRRESSPSLWLCSLPCQSGWLSAQTPIFRRETSQESGYPFNPFGDSPKSPVVPASSACLVS